MANVVGDSSSGTTNKPVYNTDVFLSFAGKDVRHGFVAHLYTALCNKGIKTFRDDKTTRKGKPFPIEVLKAIEESKISVIVLSQGYLFSKWCLIELVKILDCVEKGNQRIFPIFYKVEPSDVRSEKYLKVGMKKINERRKAKKKTKVSDQQMKEWRSALLDAGNKQGYPLQEGCDESEFIGRIVKDIIKLVPKLLDIGQHIVGLKSSLEKMKSLLEIGSESVRILLIHGIGGIGKTLVAKVLFNEIVDQFECASFLSNVREESLKPGGIASLQKKLLKEALGEDIHFGSDGAGRRKIKDLLKFKRILLVLDDVDHKEQLEKLAGECDWFYSGSQIIITSREKELLKENEVNKKHEMKELNDKDALECFCWNCFKNSQPREGFENLSDRVVQYAKGHPLALKIIGSDLSGVEDFEEWENTLHYLENNQHQDILVKLRRSYDRLGSIEQLVFLDIACFLKGKRKEYVRKGCEHSIAILLGKSLVYVKSGMLEMHDLIQQMGRQIVREENNIPEECSRLWYREHVLKVLTRDNGTGNTKGLMLASSGIEQELRVDWKGTAFENMENLRILIIRNATFSNLPTRLPNNLRWLEWDKYPLPTLPLPSNLDNLVVLDLPRGQVSDLRPLKGPNLSYLNLSQCLSLKKIPDMSECPNLRELILSGCKNLIKVDDSVGFCSELVCLDLSQCTKLESFPRRIKMHSLELFNLCFCQSLQHFPDIQGEINTLQSIKLTNVHKIKKLPESINNIVGLRVLFLLNCSELEEIPILKLECLETVKIWKCRQLSFRKWGQTNRKRDPGSITYSNLRQLSVYDCNLSDDDLDTMLSYFPKLESLELCANNFKSIPECIQDFVDLRQLDVSCCSKLENIPILRPTLHKVTALGCGSLTFRSKCILLYQASREVNDLEIVFQFPHRKYTIANDQAHYLHHCNGIVSFQTGRMFPFASFAFICRDGNILDDEIEGNGVQLFINGRLVNEKRSLAFKKGTAVLVDVRNCEKYIGLDAFLERDCNDVDVVPLSGASHIVEVYGYPCRKLQMTTTSMCFRIRKPPDKMIQYRASLLKANSQVV